MEVQESPLVHALETHASSRRRRADGSGRVVHGEAATRRRVRFAAADVTRGNSASCSAARPPGDAPARPAASRDASRRAVAGGRAVCRSSRRAALRRGSRLRPDARDRVHHHRRPAHPRAARLALWGEAGVARVRGPRVDGRAGAPPRPLQRGHRMADAGGRTLNPRGTPGRVRGAPRPHRPALATCSCPGRRRMGACRSASDRRRGGGGGCALRLRAPAAAGGGGELDRRLGCARGSGCWRSGSRGAAIRCSLWSGSASRSPVSTTVTAVWRRPLGCRTT